MKNRKNWLLAILLLLVSGICAVSCSSDDEESANNSSSPKDWLVGTWYWYDGKTFNKSGKLVLKYIITLKKDGTGTWEYKDNREGRTDDITYKYDEEDHTIRFVEYGETKQFRERKGATLYFVEDYDEYKMVDFWVKQNPSDELINSNEYFSMNSSSNLLVGTWERTYYISWLKANGTIDSETETEEVTKRLIFMEDGTLGISEKEDGKWQINMNAGSWKYNNGKITIYGTDGDEQSTVDVTTLNEKELVLETHNNYKVSGVSYEAYEKETFVKK